MAGGDSANDRSDDSNNLNNNGCSDPTCGNGYSSDCDYFFAQPLCRNVSGISVVQILEDFAGDFSGGWIFSGHFFPQSEARRSAKKIRRPNKQKIRERSVLPSIKPTPTIFMSHFHSILFLAFFVTFS